METSGEYTFGELLRQFRVREGVSQQGLADQLKEYRPKMHRNTISAWERGEYLPETLEMVQRVAEVLHLGKHDTQRMLEATREKISIGHPWNVPHQRNPFFTGRRTMLRSLHDILAPGKTAMLTQPQAISGLGGIGKTQTAIEYLYRYGNRYQAILWVRADSRENLFADFVSLADVLYLPERNNQDQNQILTAVQHWLSKHANWLLVLDNIEDLNLVDEFLPTRHEGYVLLTTRAHTTDPVAQVLELPNMKRDEGALFLLRRTKMIALEAPLRSASEVDLTQARRISLLLDGLPLALDQAGAYILETLCGLSHYINLYQERRADLLKLRGNFPSGHPESVSTTFSISFGKVKQTNIAAIELLYVFTFLHPDAMPEEIITEGVSELGSILQPVITDRLALDQAIGALLKFSLISRNPKAKMFSIHRLVQVVLQASTDQETIHLWAERTVRAINRVFPDSEDVERWPQCKRLISQALVCVELVPGYKLNFPEAGRLLNEAGFYLKQQALYPEAELLLRQALQVRELIFGPEHPSTADSINKLAALYDDQGKLEEAELLLMRGLQIREQMLGPMHPDIAISLNDLAGLYNGQGQFEKSAPLLERALQIREQVFGSEHPNTAQSLTNLAVVYTNQARYKEAEPLLMRGLQIRKQKLGPMHPDTANGYYCLGWHYDKQGLYEQAEPLYQQALEIIKEVLGFEHPITQHVSQNYISVLRKIGREIDAQQLELYMAAKKKH